MTWPSFVAGANVGGSLGRLRPEPGLRKCSMPAVRRGLERMPDTGCKVEEASARPAPSAGSEVQNDEHGGGILVAKHVTRVESAILLPIGA
jgi:hypothetical protein